MGVSYLDEKMVDYYYGVKTSEVTSSRAIYKGEEAFNYVAELGVSTPILFGGYSRFALNYIWYDDEIVMSPLTDARYGFGVMVTFSKYFNELF